MVEVSDLISGVQGRAAGVVGASIDANPDDAAEAVRLEGLTGAPAPAIHSDLEGFKSQSRSALSQDIIRRNYALADYATSHPLAAAVSNDDWANLDKFSRDASFTQRFLSNLGTFPRIALRAGEEGLEAFKAPFEEPSEFLPGGRYGANPLWTPFVAASRLAEGSFSGAFAALQGGARQAAIELGANPNDADRISNDIGLAAEGMMFGQPSPVGVAKEAWAAREAQLSQMASQALAGVRPWLWRGEEPPAGIHPTLDAYKAGLNQAGLEMLKRDIDNATATNTLGRSPQMFRDSLAAKHFGDTQIGINGDAVALLYGDKVPAPDDKLLGWVPGIADKLQAARDTGDDIHIPIADWVTHARDNPEIEKALEEHIRIWPGGITQAEAKEGWVPKATIEEPAAQARGAAGAEPMFQVGDRKLTLQSLKGEPIEEWAKRYDVAPEELNEFRDYYTELYQLSTQAGDELQILNDKGATIGRVNVTQEGNQLYVNQIQGLGDYGPNSFGPALVRDLARQLKEIYPGVEEITGHRVTGARAAAGTEEEALAYPVVKLQHDIPARNIVNLRDFLHGVWQERPGQLETFHQRMSMEDETLARAVEEEMRRIAPGLDITSTHGVVAKGIGPMYGAYVPARIPHMMYDLFGPDVIGTARHEAIHYLKNRGFITHDEWARLEQQAAREDWLGKHKIDERYPELRPDAKLEEAIAEEYKDWVQGQEQADITGVWSRLQDLWDRLKERFREILGREDWEDTFQQIHRGDIAERGPREIEARDRARFQKADEVQLMRNALVGLDQKSIDALDKKIADEYAEDLKRAEARALDEQRRKQSKEWRDNRAVMLEEVKGTLRQRPDVAADLFVGSGELYGNKLRQRIPLRAGDLTPEQRRALPRHYVSDTGFPVDQAAYMFGYGSGDAMVDALTKYTASKGNLTAQEMFKALAERVTDRQMEMKYGNLRENVVTEAMAQAFAETTQDRVIEEYYAAALKAGISPPIDKAHVKDYIKESLDKEVVGTVSSKRLSTAANRFSNLAVRALATDKPQDALQALQRKVFNTLKAAEAIKVEGEIKSFNKLAKQYSRREIDSIEPEALNYVHQVLERVGKPIQRTSEDLVKEIEARPSKDIFDYVAQRRDSLRVVHLADALLDPNWRKPWDQLTVDEFRDIHNTLKSLIHTGRDELLLHKGDMAEAVFDVVEKATDEQHLGRFSMHEWDANDRRWVGPVPPAAASALRTLGGYLVQIENLINRWDAFNPRGPLNQFVMRPIFEGAGRWQDLRMQYSRKLAAAGDKAGLKAGVENDVLRSPTSGNLMSLNRGNLRAVMLNTGTPSNLAKMAGGYKTTPEAILGWINRHATQEDWAFVGKIWDVFKEVKAESDKMYRSLSGGVPAKDVKTHTIDTPFGPIEGAYFPIIRHPSYEGKPRALADREQVLGDSFFNVSALPSADYTRERTRDVRPLALDLEQLPGHLGEMLRDIALRPALINATKVFFNEKFRREISARFGPETRDLLTPYLRDVAGTTSYVPGNWKAVHDISEFFRRNEVASLIGINVGTIAKHGLSIGAQSSVEVGPMAFARYLAQNAIHPIEFLRAARGMYSTEASVGDSAAAFALQNSAILRGRHTNFQESLTGATQALLPKTTWPGFLREKIIQYSTSPIALVDFMSALPTWQAAYTKSVGEGLSHDDAVAFAERAVRRSHGDASVANRAAILQNPWLGWVTSLYNVFSHMYNRSLEGVWRAGESLKLVKEGDRARALEVAKPIAGQVFAYSIFAALVEHLVSGQRATSDEPEWKQIAKSMAYTESAKVPLVRDLVHWLLGGGTPSAGLIEETMKSSGQIWADLAAELQKSGPVSDRHAQHIIQDAGSFIGMWTGVPRVASRAAAFGYGVGAGSEVVPPGPWGWVTGSRYGTLRHHSSTLENYMAGLPY